MISISQLMQNIEINRAELYYAFESTGQVTVGDFWTNIARKGLECWGGMVKGSPAYGLKVALCFLSVCSCEPQSKVTT